MNHLISKLSILKFISFLKPNILKQDSLKKKSVHFRRDLDALEDFLKI